MEKENNELKLSKVLDSLLVVIIFLLGLWLIVIKPLGPNFSLLPGDLGDSRFNNYLLEHFFRFISGLEKNFWTASFFYPFQNTIAFSDNLLGSASFYAIFRWLGLDRESAYQGWYILGYCLNFFSSVYVLAKLNYRSLAIGVGAFFFTFGLPLLAQEIHVQLLYRFEIPLAFYFLWKMQESPKLRILAAIMFWTIWQFFTSIYTGIFLFIFLAVIGVLLAIREPSRTLWGILCFWPRKIYIAWSYASLFERLAVIMTITFLGIGFGILVWPYYWVASHYGFSRSWNDVMSMLPTWQSFLLADRSQIWKGISNKITGVPQRWEHQLFPGAAAIILSMIGLLWSRKLRATALAELLFWTAIILIAITFSFHGYSLYLFLWLLPGIRSLRAITRIILLLMWPIALLTSTGVEKLLNNRGRFKLIPVGLAYILAGLMMVESIFFVHSSYNKASSQARLIGLRNQIPASIPQHPILILANKSGDPWYVTEIDAMLLSQEMGWPVMNGYSGNIPPGYGVTKSCRSLPKRILVYMNSAGINATSYYFNLIKRAVPIGFDDCDPNWWVEFPPTAP